uniref:Uncharacterized protein n=1 Tax=Rhizophora mucronata TaxID=61149 RepID=A0A2P2IPH0_RHIMU
MNENVQKIMQAKRLLLLPVCIPAITIIRVNRILLKLKFSAFISGNQINLRQANWVIIPTRGCHSAHVVTLPLRQLSFHYPHQEGTQISLDLHSIFQPSREERNSWQAN